ncbi:MAG TPA: hypothetical protein VF174_17050 [Micromonosporaceae bacterium]
MTRPLPVDVMADMVGEMHLRGVIDPPTAVDILTDAIAQHLRLAPEAARILAIDQLNENLQARKVWLVKHGWVLP